MSTWYRSGSSYYIEGDGLAGRVFSGRRFWERWVGESIIDLITMGSTRKHRVCSEMSMRTAKSIVEEYLVDLGAMK